MAWIQKKFPSPPEATMASFAAKLEGLPTFPGSEPVEVWRTASWVQQVQVEMNRLQQARDDIKTIGTGKKFLALMFFFVLGELLGC